MKKNHVAVVLGLVMSASLLSGCGSSQSSSSTDTGTIYGEVSEVSDDGITIEVGTMKDNGQGQPGEKPSDDQSSDSNSTDDKSTESNSTDGSTADSASTDDSKSSSDSSDSTKSSDSKQDDGEAPSMLDKTGEEKEITVSSDTEITKESQGGPGQGGPGQGGEATSGEAPSGEAPSGDDNNADNSKSGDNSSEDISLSDISEGDIVSVTYDDDGKVEKITVLMSANGGMGGGGQQSQAPDSYEVVTEYTEDTTKKNKTVSSEGTDENAK